jgi:hypothetical protein
MKNDNRVSWTARAGVVASLAVIGVLGSTVPAQAVGHAASAERTASPSTVVSTSDNISRIRVESSSSTSNEGTANQAETRSWGTILRLAKDAIKKVPSVWNKAVSSAKKGYATFVKTAWPSIKLIVSVISSSITAWDIWNLFR